MSKTYSPLPNTGPAVLAGAVLLAGYVVGPLLARGLFWNHVRKVNEAFAELPTTD